MKSKFGMQLPFAWIFAAIIGAFILFLAVYIAVKIINSEEVENDLKTGNQIGILLNPLETGFESSKTTFMNTPKETRIYAECSQDETFGKQTIRISQISFNKWTDTKIKVSFPNKYIFSKNYSEGKNFFIFSKPFDMPFKVADLVYLTSSQEKYCFLDAPKDIRDELNSLGQKNINTSNCSSDAIKVCFSRGSSCDINVDYISKIVTKKSDKLYFEGDALMYAAIFSEKAEYECQVKRLMYRLQQLSFLYRDKAILISKKDCQSNLKLELLSAVASNLEDSKYLTSVGAVAEDIGKNNDIAYCKLW